jgi:RimJ/RimL family protein N-acetyltransferase
MAADGGATTRQRRFEGVLTPQEQAAAREQGLVLAYDPVQIGWVVAGQSEEDLPEAPLSWRLGGDGAALVKRIAGTPVYPVPAGLAFRLWTEGDLDVYRAVLADPDLWRFMPEPPPPGLSDDDLRALIALSGEAPHHRVRAVIHGGGPIGQVRLELAPCGTMAEISYWLSPQARGRGIGRAAVRQFLDRMLPRLPGLRRLTARVHPDNAASARLLAACGFTASDRSATGLGPRGRDSGDWPVFIKALPAA